MSAIEKYYEDDIISKYEKLIKAQEEYIEFLGKEVEILSVSKYYECSIETYKKGETLRENIISAQKEIKGL